MMVSTPGRTISIKAVGTFELLAIGMEKITKVKVIYLNNGHPTYGEFSPMAVTIK